MARLLPSAFAVLLGAAALVLLQQLWPILWPLLWPFAVGALYAEVMEPAMRWLVARGLPRAVAAGSCLLVGIAIGTVAIVGGAVAIWHESVALRQRLIQLTNAGPIGPGPLFVQRQLDRLGSDLTPVLQQLGSAAQHTAVAMPSALFAAFITLAAAYFAMRDRDAAIAWLRVHLGAGHLAGFHALGLQGYQATWGIIRAQLLLAMGTFVTAAIGLVLIGAPYVVLAAFGAALFDFLPIVGPAALFVPWIAGELLGGHVEAALALAAVLAVIGLIRWLWTPRLLGAVVGLHPFVALSSMYLGSRLLGLPGLLVGPLATTVVLRMAERRPPGTATDRVLKWIPNGVGPPHG